MEGSVPKVERAGLVPFGMGQTKPHHYSEILKTIWHNKRAPLFTWRVLRDGVCDGCALGTNNVDNSARLCHAPSTTAMKETLGVAASTCSYSDWIGSDLVVFFGSDVPNNQPVTTKYLYYAKKHGTKVAVVNPFREPGLERYWVPSVFDSAFFGTRLADAFFQIHTGGDIAFLNGVMKHLIAEGWIDDTFIAEHTTGFEALRDALDKQPWDVLEKQSGCSKEEMRAFAEMYGKAKTAVFVWSMGITQHVFGADNVKAIMKIGRASCRETV